MQSDKLKQLPNTPGVYFHKDKNGEIIYVGKAAVLKNRVKQYFQNSRDMDIKTKLGLPHDLIFLSLQRLDIVSFIL